ncbi:unnamed protein product [Closterium sp. NIES-53]
MAPGQQASAEGMAVEGAEDEREADLAATTSVEAAGVVDTAATTRATDAAVADSTASATIVTRADICGAIATSSLMDGLLLKAKRVEELEEGEEEAVEAVAPWRWCCNMTPRADLLTEIEPSPVKHVTSALGQRAEVKGMGKAIFKGADGKMVGLKNVLWVRNLAANLISVRRLQKAGMDTSSKGAKTYTARLGERILRDLHEDWDVYNEMWQIPVVPMPKERQVAASISTKGEAVDSGDGANGRAKEIKSKKCNLGGTSKLDEHEEIGAAAKKQHKDEENPMAAAEEEYGENMWGTIASASFSNPTSATGECDWLTLHRRMGHVALLILEQLVKNEMVAGIRVKGEPDEVLGCPTCMQAKFTRYPFSSSEATAKAPLDEVVMDVVGPLKLGGAGAGYFLTIVDVYTRMTWVYVLSKKSDVAETVKTDWLPMVERQQDRLVKAIRTDRGGEFLSKEFSLWLKKNGIRHSLTMPYSPAMNCIAERANRPITETARGLLIEARLPDYFWPDAVRSAKPKVDMLQVFGCMCMALVPKHLRHNKLGAKAIWAVHLGMAQNSKGWLLWDPFTKKFLVSRDCKFMENLMYKDWKAENEAKIGMRFGEMKSSGLEHVELPLELSSGSTTTRQSSLVNGGEEAKDAEEEEEEVQQVSERAPTLPSRTTSAPRIRVTPQQRQGLDVPAAEEEGRGKRRIQASNRLTYNAPGKPAMSALAGATLMVGDDEESDYEECAFAFFSPVEMPGEPETLKEALESSDAKEWKKEMESELKSIEENGTWELVELLEQAPRQWYLKLREVLEEIGFTPSTADHSLFMLGEGEQRSFMVVYVDDILIFSPSSDLVKEVMMKLQDKFKCKALGDVNFYPGLHIERDVEKRCMRVHHLMYLEALAANFGQSEGHVATPFPSGFKCVKGPEEESVGEEERRRFHSLVGRLMYAAINTRPDVAFATGHLRRPVYSLREAPHEWHNTVRTTLAALGFTSSTADPWLFYVLVYIDDLVFATADTEAMSLVKSELQKRNTCTDLGPSALRLPVLLATAHSSAYEPLALSSTFERARIAECSVPRACGTSGMGLVLGGRVPVVLTGHKDASWIDNSTTERSSRCEAEIYAGAMAAQELRWLTYLLTNLGEQPRLPPRCGQLRLAYVATRANTADIFTKALPRGDHQCFSTVLGLDRFFLGPTIVHCPTSRLALPCRSRRPTCGRIALPLAARHAALCSPCAAICSPRAALCSQRAARLLPALPCPRAALLAATPPFAACASHLCSPPCRPLQPARRPLQPAHRPLQPASRPLQPARCPFAARRAALCSPRAAPCSLLAALCCLRATPCSLPATPCSPRTAPCSSHTALCTHAPPCCSPLCCMRRPVAAHLAARSPAGRRPSAYAALLMPALLCAALLADAPLPVRHPARPCALLSCFSAPLLVACCSALPAMASLSVLTFDHEGRPIIFDTWLDELQLCLLSDSRESVSLFDHTSGASLSPHAAGDSATRSQWLTRDAAARLAVRNHLPLAELAHFGQHKTSKALYDAVVARYSSPATAAIGRLILPYLFPALNHFLALDPTDLTVDLLEKHLLAAETSVVTVGVARGTPGTPFFEGCSPPPLDPSYTSSAAVDILGADDVGAASALSEKRRNSKGKGVKSGGSASGSGGGGCSAGGGGGRGGGSGGSGGGSVGFGGGGGGSVGDGSGGGTGSGGGGSGGGRGEAVQRGGFGGGQRQQQQRRSETPTPQQLRDRAGQTCRKVHTQHCCFSHLDDAWRSEFGDEVERPRRAELLRSRVDIFALDYDDILATMYALSVSAEGDCYLYVPLDPGIEVAAPGASESALPSTALAETLHTFTLDSSASRCFFRDNTTLTPLPALVPVSLADPSGGPILAHSSTILPFPANPSSSLSGLHLPSFSTNLVSASRPVAAPCSCRLMSHQTLLWHHRLGTPPCHAFVACTPASLFLVFPGLCLPSRPRLPHPAFLASRGDSAPLLTPPRFRGSLVGLWPFAVRYAAHQLNLWPRISLPETSPTLRWTGKVGDALVFRVLGSRASVRDTSADKLSSRTIPCVFLSFPPDAPGRQFYHPTSRRVLPSQDVTLDESIPFYHLIPYLTATLPPPPLFPAPGPPPVDPLPPQGTAPSGPAPSGVSQVDPLPGTVPDEVAVDSSVARGAASGGATCGGAEPASAEPGGAEPEGPAGASPRLSPRREPLSPQQLRKWSAHRTRLRSGAAGARGFAAGGTGAGGAGVTAGAGGTGGTGAAGPGGACTRGTGAAGAGIVGGTGAGDPGVGDTSAGGAGAEGPGAGGTGDGDSGARGAGGGGPGAGGTGAGDLGAGDTSAGGVAAGGAGAGGTGTGGTGTGDLGAGGAGAGGAGASGTGVGGTVRRRPFFVPQQPSSLPPPNSVLRQVLSLPSSTGLLLLPYYVHRLTFRSHSYRQTPRCLLPLLTLSKQTLLQSDVSLRLVLPRHVPGLLSSIGLPPSLVSPPPHQSQPQLQPNSPLPTPSPFAEHTDSLTELRELESRPASPICDVCTGRRVPCPRPPPVPGTHIMELRPSSVPLRVPLPPPPASSLPGVPDPESDLARATSPSVPRLLTTADTDPSFESTAASALVAELVDFAAVRVRRLMPAMLACLYFLMLFLA